MGAHGDLSKDGHALITRLTDEIAPEAVHQWRLDGEAGARDETRAIIKYVIRRRIAGATFRAQANHLLNRTAMFFGADWRRTGTHPGPGSATGRTRIGATTRSTTRTRASRDVGRGVGGLTRSSSRRSVI